MVIEYCCGNQFIYGQVIVGNQVDFDNDYVDIGCLLYKTGGVLNIIGDVVIFNVLICYVCYGFFLVVLELFLCVKQFYCFQFC